MTRKRTLPELTRRIFKRKQRILKKNEFELKYEQNLKYVQKQFVGEAKGYLQWKSFGSLEKKNHFTRKKTSFSH